MSYLRSLFVHLFLVLGVVGACSACGPTVQPTQPDGSVGGVNGVDNALSASIVLADQSGDLLCAGQRVSPTLILTAFHCIIPAALPADVAQLIEEFDPDYENVRPEQLVGLDVLYATYEQVIAAGKRGDLKGAMAYVERVDIKNDLALLRTDPSTQSVVPVRSGPLLVGEPVFSIGHPYGLTFSFARGHISNQCRWLRMNLPCFTQVDISLYGGSSGGGLYDAEGYLIGVASRRVNAVYGFFTPPDVVAEFVHKH